MNRYDWKDMRGTVVVKGKKPKQSLLKSLLKQRKEMYEGICKYAENYLFGEMDEVSNNR